MAKRYDVVALGELLIDFTGSGLSEQGNPLFEANPGGAPCNVLSMLCRLGRRTAFIGKVGRDGFGMQLEGVLKDVGIDTRGLCWDERVHTTLAVVQTLPGGVIHIGIADDVDKVAAFPAPLFHFLPGNGQKCHEIPPYFRSSFFFVPSGWRT